MLWTQGNTDAGRPAYERDLSEPHSKASGGPGVMVTGKRCPNQIHASEMSEWEGTWGPQHKTSFGRAAHAPQPDTSLWRLSRAGGMPAASAATLNTWSPSDLAFVFPYREDGLLYLQDAVPHGGGSSSGPARASWKGWCSRPARCSRVTWAPWSDRPRRTSGFARNER